VEFLLKCKFDKGNSIMNGLQSTGAESSMLSDDQDNNKYIIFELGGERYGSKLTDIREVVELLPTKSVPNTVESFIGVCNLRGQVVGSIDLRVRFRLDSSRSTKPVMLVSETQTGSIACVVDQILSVSVIMPTDVERNPNIVAAIPVKYIYGIGKLDSRLVTLLNIPAILSNEELTCIEESRMSAVA
jgi:purine-binding chemotaxis protein CheW